MLPLPDGLPRLLPGLHVLRRDSRHLQVGLDPPARVVLPDDPETVALLAGLRGETPLPPTLTATQRGALDALAEADLLDGGTGASRVPGSVAVVAAGLDLGPLRDLLVAAGVEVADDDRSLPSLYVVGSAGPLPRGLVDPWAAEGAPYLVLCGTGRPGVLRVGPLVEPGLTACLRCVDAHEAAHDPRRPLLLEQLAGLPAPPVDPVTLAWASAWAAREIRTHLAGHASLTWSTTLDLDGSTPAPTPRTWQRHPDCGCAWDELPY